MRRPSGPVNHALSAVEKYEHACKLMDHPDANRDGGIPWSESKVGREMSQDGYGSLERDYELRWDSARKELVPLNRTGAECQTSETILCHIAYRLPTGRTRRR